MISITTNTPKPDYVFNVHLGFLTLNGKIHSVIITKIHSLLPNWTYNGLISCSYILILLCYKLVFNIC